MHVEEILLLSHPVTLPVLYEHGGVMRNAEIHCEDSLMTGWLLLQTSRKK